MNDGPRLELLTLDHARALERFERANRAFFAERVGDRGDDYFEHFDDLLAARAQEIHEGVSLFFVIVDEDGEVLGRMNISDIDQPESTELGFRVAEGAQGRGIASHGVMTALEIAASVGVKAVKARASTENLASQRVLRHCGFDQTGRADTPAGSLDTFIGYRKVLHGTSRPRGAISPDHEHESSSDPSRMRWQTRAMKAIEVITNLHTDDVERAREFFGFLGLTEDGMDQGWVARFTSADSVACVQVVTRDATAPEDSVMTIKVDDVDAAYDEAQQRGYEIVHPITDEPWGIRRFFVRSPDGHVINVARHSPMSETE